MVRGKPVWLVFFALLSAQIVFAHQVRGLRAAIEEMPYPLSDMALKVFAFGDEQFLFRAVARWLQDVGDGGGRVRPLKDYDYDRVTDWLQILDNLDGKSIYGYYLAAHYFGAVNDNRKVVLIAKYFQRSAMADPARRWPWLVWAASRAQHPVRDAALAAALARDILSLRTVPGVPDWLVLLVPGLYRSAGNDNAARGLEQSSEFKDLRRGANLDLLKKLDNQ